MTKKLALVHTAVGTVTLIAPMIAEALPGVEVKHIIDDTVVVDLVAAGRLDRNVTRRMLNMFDSAELSDVDLIMLCCSSVGPTAETARSLVDTPILRIDAPMAERAVSIGSRVALVATVETTVEPSSELIRMKAREAGREVEVTTYLRPDGLFLLRAGKVDEHDRVVSAAIREAAKTNDVVVLAQATMTRVLPLVADVGVPVLASPPLAVERLKQLLG